jgi:hypothetical protein
MCKSKISPGKRSQKMARLVSCTGKDRTGGVEPQQRVKSIGGVLRDGTRWTLSVAAAIAKIESEEHTYYVNAGGSSPNLVVATHGGKKYLKTQLDRDVPEILLALPDC